MTLGRDASPSVAYGLPACTALGKAVPHVSRIEAIIERIRLFADFTAEEAALLAQYMTCYRAAPGTEIIREGEASDFMLLILDGEVEIVKRAPNEMPERLALAGPGKTLGEMSLIDGEPRFASCIALSETTFAVLDRAALVELASAKPHFGVKFLTALLQLVNQRLRQVSEELLRCLYQQRLRIR